MSGPPRTAKFEECPACSYKFRPAAKSSDSLPLPDPKTTGLRLVLCDIRSIFNVGSFFRTAAAFDVLEIFLCGITGGPPRADLSKVALGAERMVPWSYHRDPKALLESLKNAGHALCLFDTGVDAIPLPRSAPPSAVLVFGGERGGLSGEVKKEFGAPYRIPHPGPKDSLNVSVAGGIAAFWATGMGSRD